MYSIILGISLKSDFDLVVNTAMVLLPALADASAPVGLSSNTKQSLIGIFIFSAAFKKTSGDGFPF